MYTHTLSFSFSLLFLFSSKISRDLGAGMQIRINLFPGSMDIHMSCKRASHTSVEGEGNQMALLFAKPLHPIVLSIPEIQQTCCYTWFRVKGERGERKREDRGERDFESCWFMNVRKPVTDKRSICHPSPHDSYFFPAASFSFLSPWILMHHEPGHDRCQASVSSSWRPKLEFLSCNIFCPALGDRCNTHFFSCLTKNALNDLEGKMMMVHSLILLLRNER